MEKLNKVGLFFLISIAMAVVTPGWSADSLQRTVEVNTAGFQKFTQALEQHLQRSVSLEEAWQIAFDEATPEELNSFFTNLDKPDFGLYHDIYRRELNYPSVIITITKSTQSMTVFYEGGYLLSPQTGSTYWKVSTAKKGRFTPTGHFVRDSFSANHKSSRYNQAPMPWAIFFNGNYAIHGTNHLAELGTRASMGCIRLHPKDAKYLFGLVYEYPSDQDNVQIIVTE